MKTVKITASLLGLLFMGGAVAQSKSELYKPGTKPQLVSAQFVFTEGPSVDKAGNVFFTDQPNNKIWKYDTEGKLTIFKEDAGRSNGTYVDSHGNVVTCADENGQLWSIAPDGKVNVLLKEFNGAQFNGPNDLWIDARGGIYFTDPYFQRDYWTRKSPDPGIKGDYIYYLAQGASKPVIVGKDLVKPNGIVGTPDGKHIFAAEISKKIIYKYDIGKDGLLSNRQEFVQDRADGMTLDEQGNLYLAGNGITIYDPSGKKIDHIDIPSRWTANLCFAGKEKNILFITATESVYILPMLVHGVE
jgi:gluconolactonase